MILIFLSETVESTPKEDQHSSYLSKTLMVVQERYKTMKYVVAIVDLFHDATPKTYVLPPATIRRLPPPSKTCVLPVI